jgi:hypothetical protein
MEPHADRLAGTDDVQRVCSAFLHVVETRVIPRLNRQDTRTVNKIADDLVCQGVAGDEAALWFMGRIIAKPEVLVDEFNVLRARVRAEIAWETQWGPCDVQRRVRVARPRERRARSRAGLRRSSTARDDGGPGEPPGPALALAPPPKAIYSYAVLTPQQRGAGS